MPTTQIPIEVTYVSKLITLLTQKKKKKKIDNFIYNISYNQLLSIIKIIFFLIYQFCYGHNFFHSVLKQLVESGGQSFSHGSTTNITFIFTTQNLPFQQVVENLLKKNLWKKFVNKLSLCECIYIYIYVYVFRIYLVQCINTVISPPKFLVSTLFFMIIFSTLLGRDFNLI